MQLKKGTDSLTNIMTATCCLDLTLSSMLQESFHLGTVRRHALRRLARGGVKWERESHEAECCVGTPLAVLPTFQPAVQKQQGSV